MRSRKSRPDRGIYEGIDDPDQLAWALRAYGDLGNPDPKIQALQRWAMAGGSEDAALARATIGAPKRRPSKRSEARFDRIRKHHPALQAWPVPPRVIDVEDKGERPNAGQAPGAGLQKTPDHSIVYIDEPRLKLPTNGSGSFPLFPAAQPAAVSTADADYATNKRFRMPWEEDEPPTTKSSTLSGLDAVRVYDGLAFAMRHYGRPMNTHLVIIWSMVPGLDQLEATKLLGKYLERATKWLKVGSRPRVNAVRAPRKGEQMHYIYVHENAPQRGFHSHILTYVPPASRRDFANWSNRCLMKLFKHRRPLGREVFRLVPGYGDEFAQVGNTWRWYRYLMKQLDGNASFKIEDHDEGMRTEPLRKIIKPWRERPTLPIANIKRVGISHSIGETEQNKAGFQSALRASRIENVFSGFELRDWELAKAFPNGI